MGELTVKDRVYAEAKRQKISIPELERRCGFGNGTIGKWNKSKPSHEKLALVANALHIPVYVLSGEILASELICQSTLSTSSPALTVNEQNVLSLYRNATEEGQKMAEAVLKGTQKEEAASFPSAV